MTAKRSTPSKEEMALMPAFVGLTLEHVHLANAAF
jgi:hypothetical protein